MKKLLATAAFALILSACASNSEETAQQPQAQQGNPAVEQALKECSEAQGASQDRAAFDACMKAKGFERPAQAPAPAPAAAQ